MSEKLINIAEPEVSENKPSRKHRINKSKVSSIIITTLLIIGCAAIFFPLYMTIIIALKSPSEMTNDIAGALALPQTFSLDNFAEAMRVTDFWHSLGNSILITGASIVLSVIIHSMAGYAIGRNMNRKKASS